MLLPDVNVWLALTFDSHVHHPTAKAWFDALSTELCLFCRMTQQGFLRLATNPKVFGIHALTLTEAWQKYDIFQSDPRISYVDEPTGVENSPMLNISWSLPSPAYRLQLLEGQVTRCENSRLW